jgi:PQQ enzyme repeat
MFQRLPCGLLAIVVGAMAGGCSNKNNRGAEGGASGDAQAGAGGAAVVNSVYERNNHASRDGHFLQPTLTKVAAAKLALDGSFAGNYAGRTWASPLYLENGPAGKGVFIVVTNNNDVFALDETTGSTVWTRNIGTAPGRSGAGCGDILPIGIISTPVIDPQTRTIYVAGAIGNANTITAHQIHALSPEDGSERLGWPVDVTGIASGTATLTAAPQNQRSALSLVGGILYVAYGGHNGDCGNYRGWVVAVDVTDPTKRGAFATAGTRGEGIWAAGGMASDGNGVIAVTGNNLTGATTHLDSEEVVRVTGLGVVDRTNTDNIFYPASWMGMDRVDADFGASSPVYLAQPSPMVAAVSKDGHLYLINSQHFGGMASQLADLVLATGGAMVIHTTPAAYASAQGMHVVLTVNTGAQCTGTGANGKAVMSVLIPAGTPPVPRVVWCVPVQSAALGFPASPMATTTDGTANAIVWYMNGTQLMGVDGDTGATLFAGAAADACAGVHKWTAPIAVKGRIIVAGDNHLCSWSPH